MKIDVLTLFPEMFEGPLSHSILKRAQEKGQTTTEESITYNNLTSYLLEKLNK